MTDEPDDSLAGSEQWAREFAADYPGGHMDVLLAEFDRRGRALARRERLDAAVQGVVERWNADKEIDSMLIHALVEEWARVQGGEGG